MIIKRSKLFAGYSETPISGTSYYPGQVSNFVLDSIDKSTEVVDKIPVVRDNEIVKKRVGRVKGIVRPLKKLLNKKKEQNKNK